MDDGEFHSKNIENVASCVTSLKIDPARLIPSRSRVSVQRHCTGLNMESDLCHKVLSGEVEPKAWCVTMQWKHIALGPPVQNPQTFYLFKNPYGVKILASFLLGLLIPRLGYLS